MRILLKVTEGPHAGAVFAFDWHDHFLVGRSKEARFRLALKDPYFSRIHFLVELNPPHCRLLDMHSTNGTFVNGRRVDSAELCPDDEIRAGQTVLRVGIERAEEAPVRDDVPTIPPTR